MCKRYMIVIALFLVTFAAAASTLSSSYTINDQPMTELSVEELYSLHSATVEALNAAYNTDCAANGPDDYIWFVNTNSHKYHYPYCLSALEASENGKLVRGSASLMSKDYSPCGRCNPPIE